jgi:hypothetical protein
VVFIHVIHYDQLIDLVPSLPLGSSLAQRERGREGGSEGERERSMERGREGGER